MLRFLIVVILFGQFFSSVPTFAQTDTATNTDPYIGPSIATGEASGPLKCFDYYMFGSVHADVQPVVAQTDAGSVVTFVGEIKSDNPYPLMDGTLYVKIFRRSETTFSQGDGNEVVDQFIVKENITLREKGALPIKYEWKVPANAEGGEYYAAYFFTTAKRYNLMGLSFTDDVVGNQAPFTVSTVSSPVPVAKLSKVHTMLNGENHNFAAFPLRFDAGDVVMIKTTIANPTNQTKTLPLQWNQYAWDAMNPENLRFTKTEVVTLAPNEVKEVTYEAQPQRESVVYVTATTQDIEVKSILNIRYVRDGIEETRINFPGLSIFPIKKETESTLFACAHSTNLPLVPGNTLTLSLRDRDGSIIHQYKYEGDIAGAMSGFGEKITPSKNVNYAVLTATLERNGVIVEQVTQTYDCEAIDPTTCLPDGEILTSWFNFFTTHLVTMVVTLFILIILLVLFYLYKSRKNFPEEGIDMTTPTALLFFVVFVSGFLFTPVTSVEAKSVRWDKTETNDLAYYWNCSGSCDYGANGWDRGLSAPIVTINYYADIYNADTGQLINDGSTLPVGTRVTVVPKPASGSDVSWAGTGFTNDSPNGYWIPGAAAPAFACNNADRTANGVSDEVGVRTYDVYNPLSINPPNTAVVMGGTASLTHQGGNTYRIDSAGSITARVTFSSTYGEFYYRYKVITTSLGNDSLNVGQCYGNQTAMEKITATHYVWFCPIGYCPTTYDHEDYQLQVPEQEINFSLTAVSTNNNPNTPTIGGPSSAQVNSLNSFTFTASDSDGDTLRYGLADATCTTVSEWLPGSGYVASGASQSKNNMSWSVPGTYTLYVLAEDSKGARSACASHTITINPAPPITADLTINGSNGPIDVPKNTAVAISWMSANAASCTKWGGTWGSGQSVPLTGTDTTIVTATTDYMVNCGGVIDIVHVNVVNQAPQAPAVTYVSGALEANSAITFNIQGTDPDADNIFYEVDWDNDGFQDATTMTVPSGSVQSAIYNWSTAGTKTFQARTVDTGGLRSGWTSHQVTLSLPIPGTPASITATCPAPGSALSVSWSSVSGATSYNYRVDNQSNSWTGACPATNPGDYCQDGYGGTSVALAGIPGSNFNAWVHACNSSGCSAPIAVAVPVSCVQYPNFSQPNITYTLSPGFDPVSGFYDYVDVTFQTSNDGGSDTSVNANYELQFDRGRDGYEHTVSGSLGTLTVGQTVNRAERVSGNIPFGNARIRVFADNTNAVTETNEGDNVRVLDLTIPPPNPNLNLVADRYQVRNGETVTLTWSTGIPYAMNCRLYGPGMDVNPSGSSGARITQPIAAKSEYTFACTEPNTNTTFTDKVTIETQGEIEEI